MPSREFRRLGRKKSKKPATYIEKKRTAHPFLYIFSVIILIIIVVTFVGGPLISRSAGSGSISFGTYKGKSIDYYPGNYFSQQKDIYAERLRQSGGNDNLETQAYKVWRNAFDQTVFHTAVLLEAEKSNIWVSENLIDKAVISSGQYMVDGEFNEEKYRNTPNSERFATRKLFKEQIIHERYLADVLGAQKSSRKEMNFIKEMADVQRSFSFVHFLFSDLPEEKVLSYAEENRNRFKKIKLSRILIKSSASEAEEIKKKLDARISSFEELARAHSKDLYAEKGGDMGWRYFYDLEGDFDSTEPVEKIFSLNEGDLTSVLSSRFGWVIYRSNSPSIEMDIFDDETLQIARHYIMRYEKGMVEDYFQEKGQNFSTRANEIGFRLAAIERGIVPSETDYFPLNYQGIFFMTPVRALDQEVNISSASYSREFFEVAFSIRKNQISDPIMLDDQVIVLNLEDERKTPERGLALMEDFYRYFAARTLEADLQNVLMDPDFLEDNFNNIFYQYIFPRQ